MAKVRISDKKCFFHTNATHGFKNLAATCEVCYDLALDEQRAQWARQREQAHQAYLASRNQHRR